MERRQYLATATGIAATLVAGCSSSGDGGDGGGSGEVVQTTEVSMVNSQFDPRNIHVSTGATVTWTNDDSTGHTVTNASDNWSLDQQVAGGESAQFTFEESGVYDVYCRFHGSADLTGMSMKVGVGDATIEDPLGGSQQQGGAY